MHPTDNEEEAAPRGAVSRLKAVLGIAFGIVAALMILVILVLTGANVIGRYLFTAPIRGAEEATGFMVVAIVMFGVAEAYRKGDHIRIDLLFDYLSPQVRRWFEVAGHLAVLAVGAIILHTGIHTVQFSRMFGAYSAGYLQIPMWIPQSSLIVGGALLSIMAVLQLLHLVLALRRSARR